MGRASYTLSCILALGLSGCVRVEYLPIPIPEGLLIPCVHEASPQSNGELVVAYEDARITIQECDERVRALRDLNNKPVQ